MKTLLLTGFLGLAALFVFLSLYRDYAPQTSVDLQISAADAADIAEQYLQDSGFDLAGLYSQANFQFDSGNTLFLEKYLGMAEAHTVLRKDSLHSHAWRVYFFDRAFAQNQQKNQFDVSVSPSGRIFAFNHMIPDSVGMDTLDSRSALRLAENFLVQHGYDPAWYNLDNSSLEQRPNRRDYTFYWSGNDSVFNMTAKVWVRVQGDTIGGFQHSYLEPEAFRTVGSEVSTVVTFIVIASYIATFAMIIFVISLFLKKYHDGEVGISAAIKISLFLFGIILIDHLLRLPSIGVGVILGQLNLFNTRIAVFIMSVFMIQAFLVAMTFSAWSVGESSARQGWSDKLAALDGLFNGKFFTLALANSVFRGYTFGLLLLAAVFLGLKVISGWTNIGSYIVNLSGIPGSYVPSLSAVVLAFCIALINEIVFRFLFIAWLRERTGKLWPGVLVSSLLWTLVAFTLWDFPVGYLESFPVLFALYFLISVVLGLILIRFGLLTGIVSNFVLLAFTSYATPVLAASGSYFQIQSIIFYAIMVLPLAVAFIGSIKRETFQYKQELVPSHIRRISERERMTRELEIARNVQMSLLPKRDPNTDGYDIAGICIPALEVGGDYYDFFQLGDGKIGIAIGDVSGKGVPAAIYMTLTKGILQSHANESLSPKEVLSKLNRQMYYNIEKNSFVSLFYAVLDMENNTIRFARAGHNPAILAHHSYVTSTLLEPNGIAVGLEKGDQFSLVLEEHEIALNPGDVITFYTDGFTEACTASDEEFGEEMLEQVISDSKALSANAIIQNVVRSVKRFVGNHPQHDDMTMVVLKAL